MGDISLSSGSNRNSEATSVAAIGKKVNKGKLVASGFPRSVCKHITTSITGGKGINGAASQAALFLLKIAALETVRRVSSVMCPIIWQGFQALQVLCYPPLSFIQRWAPFKGLIKGMQLLSRPLLVLSFAAAVSEHRDSNNGASDGTNPSPACSEHSQLSTTESTLDKRYVQTKLKLSVEIV